MATQRKRGAQTDGVKLMFAGVIIALIIMVGLFAVALQLRHSQTPTQPTATKVNSVTVDAAGYVYAKPTQAVVQLFVNATGNTSKEATENISVELSALNKTLYGYVNGNTSLIQTSYFNVYKGYRPATPIAGSGPSGIIVASTTTIYYSNVSYYTAQEYIQVTLPEISRLNGMLFNISDVPNVQVQNVEATIAPSQVSALKEQAISAALANATQQANVIIGSATVVSRNVTIENYYALPYLLTASGGEVSGAPGTVASQLGPIFYNGTSTVSASVSAVFYYN